MADPVILFLNGAPATGKSTLAKRLRCRLGWPLLSKDAIKEPMFDEIGIPDGWRVERGLSGERLDRAASTILLQLVEVMARAGQPCVIDATFDAEHVPTLKAIAIREPFRAVQVHCHCHASILTERYQRRARGAERHPGHLDHILAEARTADQLCARFGPLDLPGPLESFDTTDPSEADVTALIDRVVGRCNGTSMKAVK